jgi:hypothetical protein
MDEHQLAARVQQVEAEGKSRFGDDWSKYVSAIGKVAGGNPQQLGAAMREVLSQNDPATIVQQAGREALANLASGNVGGVPDAEAERQWSAIRDRERREWRTLKGHR